MNNFDLKFSSSHRAQKLLRRICTLIMGCKRSNLIIMNVWSTFTHAMKLNMQDEPSVKYSNLLQHYIEKNMGYYSKCDKQTSQNYCIRILAKQAGDHVQ